MTRKAYTLILFSLMFIGLCSGFTLDGDFNYQTASLGVVHFSNDVIVMQLGPVGNLTRFLTLVWNGNNRQYLSVDASADTNVTFTGIQANTLIYDVESGGVATQTIDYAGKGRPSDVDGGTIVMDGDNVVVTTNGDVTVTLSWNPNAVLIGDNILVALGVMSLIPFGIGAFGLLAMLNGSIEQEEFTKIAMAVATSVLIIFIIGLIATEFYSI